MIKGDDGTDKILNSKVKLLQKLPLVKLQIILYRLFKKNGPHFDDLKKVIKDLPLEDAMLAVGIRGNIVTIKQHHWVRWKSLMNVTSQKHLLSKQIDAALTRALAKATGRTRQRILEARGELKRLRHQGALVTDIEPIVAKLLDKTQVQLRAWIHKAWRYITEFLFLMFSVCMQLPAAPKRSGHSGDDKSTTRVFVHPHKPCRRWPMLPLNRSTCYLLHVGWPA